MTPTCGVCRHTLTCDAIGGGDCLYLCDSEDCPEFGQPYTLSEVENKQEAAFNRSQQTGVDAWEGGFAADN